MIPKQFLISFTYTSVGSPRASLSPTAKAPLCNLNDISIIIKYLYKIIFLFLFWFSYQQYESIATVLFANDFTLIFSDTLSRNGSKPVIPIM